MDFRTTIKPVDVNRETTLGIRSYFVFLLLGNLMWILFACVSIWVSDGTASAFQLLGMSGLLTGAAMIVGGFFGFLFGIPRVVANVSAHAGDAQVARGTHANTNLEQISDWLTKLLVGAGLTQINKLPAALAGFGAYMAPAFAPLTSAAAYALCVAGAFGMTGFLWAYFESRTSLIELFRREYAAGKNAPELEDSAVAGSG